jgi:spermidine synthase
MKINFFSKYTLSYLLVVIGTFILTDHKPFTFFDKYGFSGILSFLFGEREVAIKNYLLSLESNFLEIALAFYLFILIVLIIYNSKKIIFMKFITEDNFKVSNDNLLLNIFLAAALTLFLELAIIRIHSIYIHIFSFFKNLSLFSCFFGLGIGYAIGRKKLFSLKWTYPLLCLQILFLFIIYNTPLNVFFINPVSEQLTMGRDTAQSILQIFIIYVFTISIFLFNVLVFIPLGQLTSSYMLKTNKLKAYGANLLGSLFGILLITLLSYIWTPPILWLAFSLIIFIFLVRKNAKLIYISSVSFLLLIFSLNLNLNKNSKFFYSPYQNIVLEHLNNPLSPVLIKISHIFFQSPLNLSKRLTFERPDISPGNIFGYHVDIEHEREFYDIPYRVNDFLKKNVLIVGSGTGNDVSAALRNSKVDQVDAVDIDPLIIEIGKSYHPERPYQNEKVNIYVDDARSFIKKVDKKYDLIVYGLLDSQSNLSAKGGVRLDSFVYTVEAFKEAKNILNENGYLSISFFVQQDEIREKLSAMLEKAFNTKPLILKSQTNDRYIFLVSKNEKKYFDLKNLEFFKHYKNTDFKQTLKFDISTDDWPFFYMPKKIYPISYLIMIITILFSCLLYLKKNVGFKITKIYLTPFFLGAGFMLIEAKGITELAKVFGSTWSVLSIIISSVLILAFLANYIILKKIFIKKKLIYALILLSIALGFLYSHFSINLKFEEIILPLLLTMPIFFSGLAFSNEILINKNMQNVISSNIFGALFGGLLEYNSMYFGYSALYFLAAIIYMLAYFFTKSKI